MAQTVKNLPAIQKTWVRSLGREDALEKEMATHSNILAWKIPWQKHWWATVVVFSCSVVSDSLQPHELQDPRFPCPSQSPRACSNSCPLTWWRHPTISSSVVAFLPSNFPSFMVFSNELALHIRWPKYWSFSISPSNEYSGLISFRIDWRDLLAPQKLSGVFSSTTIQKHQFFSTQPSLWSNYHIGTRLLEKS